MYKGIVFGIIGLVAAILILTAVKADMNKKGSIVDRMNYMHKQMKENFKEDPKFLEKMDRMHESMVKQIEQNPDKKFHCPMMENIGIEDMEEMHKSMHGSRIIR